MIANLKPSPHINDILKSLGTKKRYEDCIVPYFKWADNIEVSDYLEYEIVADQIHFDEGFRGIILTNIGEVKDFIPVLTDHEYVGERCSVHGVCDNASQVLSKYKVMLNKKENVYIILLEPCFKDLQDEENLIKWKTAGEYIGIKELKADTLRDEPDLKFVFKFAIYKVRKK